MSGSILAVARAIAFVFIALTLCGIVFEIAGYSALTMFTSIAEGAFMSRDALMNSLRWTLPLFLSATGALISFRCGYFNIGAQGQFYMGAIGAAFVADRLDGAPAAIVIQLAIVVGVAAGALWSAWPGILRIRTGTNEVITTLMGNFISALFLVYVTSGPLKDPSGTGTLSASRPVAAMYRISTSSGVSPIILTIIAAVGLIMWVLVNRTAFGVLSSLTGRNPVMVTWQGARLSKLGLSAFLISGGMAGLAGAIELLGPSGRLIGGFLPTHGFTAILIALVAGLSVSAVGITSLFFGGLAASSLFLPVIAGLPAAAIDIINAAIALFITAQTIPKLRLFGRVLWHCKVPRPPGRADTASPTGDRS